MIREQISPNDRKKELGEILEISGENIRDCMHCGKCSAGCPASAGMDVLPHQMIRLLQLGQVKKVLESQSLWTCASCFTCASRCPRNIDISKLMEATRLTIIRAKGQSKLRPDDVPSIMDDKTPHQAIVSGFRKYNK